MLYRSEIDEPVGFSCHTPEEQAVVFLGTSAQIKKLVTVGCM